MKFGVDVNKEYLSKRALEKIKEKGHTIVDLTVEKWDNKGQEVFKKVLLANITNIDFYIGIEFRQFNEDYKIFYSDNECSRIYSFKIKENLMLKSENVICEEGNHLYLIKNMNSPGVYIVIPLKENKKDNIEIIDKITEKLIAFK